MQPNLTLAPWNDERLQPLLARLKFLPARRLLTYFSEQRVCVVGDKQTLRAWHNTDAFEDVLMLPSPVVANEMTVRQIIHHAHEAQVIVAVGSGTINDLCKMASFRLSIPYIVCPTALSMNGYLSPTASIEVQGLKQSLPAHLPRAVVLDKTVLTGAPHTMTLSGFADVMCYHTVRADMLWAKHMADQPYDETPFQWLENLPAITPADIQTLTHAVLLSGLGMAHANSSAPASQAEHQFVHTLHLMLGENTPQHFHGTEIGVATCLIANIQAEMVGLTTLPNWPDRLPDAWLAALPEAWRSKAQDIFAIKRAAYTSVKPNIAMWQAESMQSIEKSRALKASYQAWHMDTTPAELGWANADVEMALRLAPWLRERFFALDMWSVAQM